MPKLSEITAAPRRIRLSDVQAVSPAVGVPELLRRQELTPEQRAARFEAERARLSEEMQAQNYAELNPVEKLGVGFGRGAEALGEGGQQLLTYLSRFGAAFPGAAETELSKQIAEAAEAEQLYQKATPDGTLAGVGRLGFNVASTAIPASKIAQLAKVPAIASPLARAATEGAIGGGLGAATAPITEGDAESYGGQLLSQLLKGVTVGGAVGGGLNLAGQGIKAVLSPRSTLINAMTSPQTPAARAIFGVPDEEFVRRGASLERELGVELSPAQKTGQKFTTAMENAARQNAFTADRMAAKDAEITKKATAYIDSIMDGVSKRSQTPESAGEAVQNALRNATKSMIEERRKVGNEMYGALRGTGAKIQYSNLADELQKIVDEGEGALGKDAQAASANAKRMLAQITQKGETPASSILDVSGKPIIGAMPKEGAKAFDIDAALKSRSEFSSGAAGTGQVFQDLESAAQRRYSARLRDALEDDFAAAEAGDVSGALKAANETYRAHSQRIDQVKKTYLGKLLGQDLANEIDGLTMQTVAPEQVAAKLMRLQPSEARQLNAFLRKHDPEASDAMRRAILDDAYAKMIDRPISAGAEAPADIGAFVREIKKNKALTQWFSKEEMAKLGNVEELAKRLGDKFGYNFSGTAAQSSLLELIKPGMDRVGQLAILNKVANMQGSAPLPTKSLGRLAPAAEASRKAAAITAGAVTAEPDSGGQ